MLGLRSASFRSADLTRAALTPIAARHGIDYDESAFTAPASDAELGFEALRCCTGLVMAFAYEDAWPDDNRALRKLASTAASIVRDSFHDRAGRDAITWAAVQYGRVMAEPRRASLGARPVPLARGPAGPLLVRSPARRFAGRVSQAAPVIRASHAASTSLTTVCPDSAAAARSRSKRVRSSGVAAEAIR